MGCFCCWSKKRRPLHRQPPRAYLDVRPQPAERSGVNNDAYELNEVLTEEALQEQDRTTDLRQFENPIFQGPEALVRGPLPDPPSPSTSVANHVYDYPASPVRPNNSTAHHTRNPIYAGGAANSWCNHVVNHLSKHRYKYITVTVLIALAVIGVGAYRARCEKWPWESGPCGGKSSGTASGQGNSTLAPTNQTTTTTSLQLDTTLPTPTSAPHPSSASNSTTTTITSASNGTTPITTLKPSTTKDLPTLPPFVTFPPNTTSTTKITTLETSTSTTTTSTTTTRAGNTNTPPP